MYNSIDQKYQPDLYNFLLGCGDDLLIIGHRLSEWCGHAPIIEEDIALGNMALDCLGQASAFLQLAAEVEGKNRSEDDLAYFRDAIQFRNLLIVELPKGDFAFTIARQVLFDTYYYYLMEELQNSKYDKIAGIAQKAFKEIKYHLRHINEWIIRLGDGTGESHMRSQKAIDELWMYTGEMFETNGDENILFKNGIIPDSSAIKKKWENDINLILDKATLRTQDSNIYMVTGGRKGIHTEHLGHLLSEMQILARSYPGVKW